jgi:hypothetical protein
MEIIGDLAGGTTASAAVFDNAAIRTSSFRSDARSVAFADADGDHERVEF